MSTNPLCEASQSLFKGDIVASVIVQTLCMRRRGKEGGRGKIVKRGGERKGGEGRDGEGGREEEGGREGGREGGGGSGRVKR